jgi:hypothetical protein
MARPFDQPPWSPAAVSGESREPSQLSEMPFRSMFGNQATVERKDASVNLGKR